jgi:hypothetical protein
MRESCTSGSVRGASSDRRLYSTLLLWDREMASGRWLYFIFSCHTFAEMLRIQCPDLSWSAHHSRSNVRTPATVPAQVRKLGETCRYPAGRRLRMCSKKRRKAGRYRLSMPPRAPRTMARPTEPPSEPPRDLPISAAILPATWLVTVRVTLRAISCPEDRRWLRGLFVPKIVPTIAPICPSIPPAGAAPCGAD